MKLEQLLDDEQLVRLVEGQLTSWGVHVGNVVSDLSIGVKAYIVEKL